MPEEKEIEKLQDTVAKIEDINVSEYKLYLHKQLTQNNQYRDEPLIWLMP